MIFTLRSIVESSITFRLLKKWKTNKQIQTTNKLHSSCDHYFLSICSLQKIKIMSMVRCCGCWQNFKLFQNGNAEKFSFGSTILVGKIGNSGKLPLRRRLIKEPMVNFYRCFKLEAVFYDSKLITFNKRNLWQGSGVFWSISAPQAALRTGRKGKIPSPFFFLGELKFWAHNNWFFCCLFFFFLSIYECLDFKKQI